MPPVLVALFLALGVSGWVYSKITRRTGGITQHDIIVTAVVGILVFFISWTLFSMIPTN